VWIVWIESKKPYMWDHELGLRLDVGLAPLNGNSPPCGKNQADSSTDLSTERTFSHPIHILETPKIDVHIWGYRFIDIFGPLWTSPQRKALIHKLSRVIHKSQSWKAAMGDYPAPYM
jgi:hypothetical protein